MENWRFRPIYRFISKTVKEPTIYRMVRLRDPYNLEFKVTPILDVFVVFVASIHLNTFYRYGILGLVIIFTSRGLD